MDINGWTPLHWAVKYSTSVIVEMLLDRGADVNAASKYGWTPLHLAAGDGSTALVETLLDRGADVNAKLKPR